MLQLCSLLTLFGAPITLFLFQSQSCGRGRRGRGAAIKKPHIDVRFLPRAWWIVVEGKGCTRRGAQGLCHKTNVSGAPSARAAKGGRRGCFGCNVCAAGSSNLFTHTTLNHRNVLASFTINTVWHRQISARRFQKCIEAAPEKKAPCL